MTANAQINAAWEELTAFAVAADALRLNEVRAIFSIGSLPGGYFRPGQSDLDVLVLLRGMPHTEMVFNAAQQEEKQRLETLAAQAAPYEMERYSCTNPACSATRRPDAYLTRILCSVCSPKANCCGARLTSALWKRRGKRILPARSGAIWSTCGKSMGMILSSRAY